MARKKKRRDSCVRVRPLSVLGSFGVVLMSLEVNFHVVRSALQNSMCVIKSFARFKQSMHPFLLLNHEVKRRLLSQGASGTTPARIPWSTAPGLQIN